MSQRRRRKIEADSWPSYEETLQKARALAEQGVSLTAASRQLKHPKESLRLMERRHNFAFVRAAKGRPGKRSYGEPLADGKGLYRDATHPIDKPLCPEVLDVLKRRWI